MKRHGVKTTTICHCEMEENKEGDYILYEDMLSLLKKLVDKGTIDKEGMNIILEAMINESTN